MQPNDKAEFMKTLIGMAAIKPGKPLSPEGYELFWNAMQCWPLDEFKRAAAHLARTCEFMPNPYHFEQLRKTASGANADESWTQILESHGHTDDAAGMRALRSLGGWGVVGFADTSRLPWLKERYREAYENFADSSSAQESLPQISRETRPLLADITKRMRA